MDSARHFLLDNKVQLFQRPRSPYWQASCSFGEKQHKKSTGEESLARAKDVARDWYLELLGKYRGGELKQGTTFRKAAEYFLNEYEVITEGERSPAYVASHGMRLRVHLLPFFGDKIVTDITPGLVQDYRIHRMTSRKDPKTQTNLLDANGNALRDPKTGKCIKDPRSGVPMRPSRVTLHHEIITLRHVLKTANRHGWLPYLPDLSAPYKASSKVSHRAWFSPQEYTQLYKETQKRAKTPPNPKWKWECEQLHDYVLFVANTGLRPDEVARLEFRDVEIVDDGQTGERILEIEVRGKRGVGYCKSMPAAVHPFERLQARLRGVPKDQPELTRDRRERPSTRRAHKTAPYRARASAGGFSRGGKSLDLRPPGPRDRLFPTPVREILNSVMEHLELKLDREGQRRSAYSLRHTYISMRLMEGADIYQVAKNCRTSVEMIEKHYASHIKNMIDTSAINVRKGSATKGAKARLRKRSKLNS